MHHGIGHMVHTPAYVVINVSYDKTQKSEGRGGVLGGGGCSN